MNVGIDVFSFFLILFCVVTVSFVWLLFSELLVFIMFFVVTWVLIASVTSPDVYHVNQTIKKTFLR